MSASEDFHKFKLLFLLIENDYNIEQYGVNIINIFYKQLKSVPLIKKNPSTILNYDLVCIIPGNSFGVYIRLNLFLILLTIWFQIQHPRSQLSRFDLVVTPQHDYYALTPQAQEQVPKFLRKYITPDEPPNKNVVCI